MTAEAETVPLDGSVDLTVDRELVLRFQAGDRGAFSDLYAHYHPRLLRLCQRRLGRGADAEEAVAESFARAWRALPRLSGDRRFYPWLRVIAFNVCTDVLRRRARLVPVATVPEGATTRAEAEIDEAVLRQVDVQLAWQALASLSERHRRVLHLRESSGWSTQRIAEAEGMAAPAVDVLLWRARQALKRQFVALAEGAGRVGALLGIAAASVHRLWSRALSRMVGRVQRLGAQGGSLLAAPVRTPSGVALSLALAGTALAGGAVVLGGSGTTGPAVVAPAAHVAALRSGAVSGLTPGPGPATVGSTSTASGTVVAASASGPGSAAASVGTTLAAAPPAPAAGGPLAGGAILAPNTAGPLAGGPAADPPLGIVPAVVGAVTTPQVMTTSLVASVQPAISTLQDAVPGLLPPTSPVTVPTPSNATPVGSATTPVLGTLAGLTTLSGQR